MKARREDIDAFDRAYCSRIRDAVWDTIIAASRDPATNVAQLRNYEIYDALLQLQAMILASSKEAGSPAKMRGIGNEFAKRLSGWLRSSKQHTTATACHSASCIPMKCNDRADTPKSGD
jgi:hypothetical protein